MSIIPFIVSNNQNETIVTESSKFNQNNKKVLIMNLDQSQLDDHLDSNASYDLRVGKNYRDHMRNETVSIDEDQEITLKPGAAIIIETAEWVHFPNLVFGQILPKVTLLHKGVSNTTSKVDPGYHGALTITLFNLGKDTITLKRNQKFCTLVLQDVSSGTLPYQKEGKTIPNTNLKTPILKRFKSGLKEYSWLISIIIAILAVIVNFFNGS